MSAIFPALRAYAPNLLLDRYHKDPTPPDSPIAESFSGAVLFADLAGFTTVTEQILDQYPEDGLLRLARLVEDYLARQIDIITEYGGDVLKFAGDAILAVWATNADESLPIQVHRAVRTALQIQRSLGNYEPGHGLKFKLRIGIGAGSITALHAGGIFNRMELIIAGETLEQVSRAERTAEPGQVAISPRAASLMDRIQGGYKKNKTTFLFSDLPYTRVGKPLEFPPVTEAAEKALQCYIPRSIISLLEQGETSADFSIRTVAVLFIRILDWPGPVISIHRVQSIMQTIQSCLYRYEGSINRFGIEDKGAIILAAFGLPPLKHDDDSVRALKSARDMRKALNDIKTEAVMGIATGTVFCGSMGNDRRSEYTVHGNVVNLASRIMSASDGIMCDEYTRDHAPADMQFEGLQPQQVKGIKQPVRFYRYIEDEQ